MFGFGKKKIDERSRMIASIVSRQRGAVAVAGDQPTSAFYDTVNTVLPYRSEDAKRKARAAEATKPLASQYLWLNRINVFNDFKFKALTKDAEKNDLLQSTWAAFTRKGNLDVTGTHSLNSLLGVMGNHFERDGEWFVVIVRDSTSRFGIRLQVINPDLVDKNLDMKLKNGNYVRQGIEINKYGRPVHYWVSNLKGSKTLGGRHYDPIKASDMLHGFIKYDASQYRGISSLEQSLDKIQSIDDFAEASLNNAKEGAKRLGFRQDQKSDQGENAKGYTPEDLNGLTDEQLLEIYQNMNQSNPVEKIEGMTMTKLGQGEEFIEYNSRYPDNEYANFFKSQAKVASSGLHMAYASVTGDTSDGSYASLRMGLISERDGYNYKQNFAKEEFLMPVWENLIEALAFKETFKSVELDRLEEYQYKVRFDGRKFEWLDPWREVRAWDTLQDMGVATDERFARYLGYGSIDEVVEEEARVLKLRYDKYKESLGDDKDVLKLAMAKLLKIKPEDINDMPPMEADDETN